MRAISRRILVVLSNSDIEPDTLAHTITVTANNEPLEVILLAPLRLSETPGLSPLSFQIRVEEARQSVRESYTGILNALQRLGYKVQFHTTTGVLAVQAGNLARELRASLILVGETHPTLMERLLRIGVLDRLTESAPCPIVIFPTARQKSNNRPVPQVDYRQTDWQILPPLKYNTWSKFIGSE